MPRKEALPVSLLKLEEAQYKGCTHMQMHTRVYTHSFGSRAQGAHITIHTHRCQAIRPHARPFQVGDS